ncbi:hypothetical protein BGX26_002980 [Mortierella sp. AD094]|nr:hypothetical protein BGX26_002980 [Mortierella sp. AD094]
MKGINGQSTDKRDIHWVLDEPSTMTRDSCSAFSGRLMTDRVRFLRLLVRMRRVILQDAVLYLKPDEDGKTLSNSIFESLPHIFKSKLFQDFQAELLTGIDKHHMNPNLINTTTPNGHSGHG